MRGLVLCLALAACDKSAPPKQGAPVPSAPSAAPASPIPGIDLPVLAGAARAAIVPGEVLAITKRGIVWDGMAIVSIVDGAVPGEDKEGGVMGRKIPRLTAALGKRPAPARPPLQLAFDRTVTYQLMIEVMFSAKQPEAGWKDFTILAQQGDQIVGFPISLPVKTPGDLNPADVPLAMVVSISRTEILVWSMSQREGTLQEPKARVAIASPTAMADVAAALAAIAKRYPAEKQIVFQADAGTSMQRVVELLGAITPAFPDVVFSSGFE